MLKKVKQWLERRSTRQPRIRIVIPYFGQWPEWMALFLASCRANHGIDWLFYSDCPQAGLALPDNVQVRPMLLEEFIRLAGEKLGLQLPWREAYKICDLRPGFGEIFSADLAAYDFWGWGDIDVIYGDMHRFLAPLLPHHDCLSFSKAHLSGHLCLWRNAPEFNGWFRSLPDWQQRMTDPQYTHLDESAPEVLPGHFRTYAEYSFNTPLSPKTPWTDGTFNCPSEWYWKPGSLTTDIDGDRQFLYLHFMHWKGGWWPRHCGNAQWEKLSRLVHVDEREAQKGFRINEQGFFPLDR